MRHCLLAFMLALGMHSTAKAQSPGQGPSKLPDEYREIVCDAAVDVNSPLHELALRVVEKQGFRDPKFDAFIRQTLVIVDQVDPITDASMETVQRLMPYCDIPKEERVRLLLDQLAASADTISGRVFEGRTAIDLTNQEDTSPKIASLAGLAESYQVELRAELKKRLDIDHPHYILVAAVNLLKIGGQDLLPLLMRAAKSDDEQLQYAAIDAINQLQMDQSDVVSSPLVRDRQNSIKRMAEMIIRRSDTDGDARLSSSEWSTSNSLLGLPSFSHADSNQDGFVTDKELEISLESRHRQR